MGWVINPGALVGQTLWILTTIVGWVASPRSWVGKNAPEPWKTWIETNLVMVSDVRPWVGIIGWGLRWFGLLKPWFGFLGLFHEIPHSCLKYGARMNGWKKDLVQPNLWSGGTWKSLTWLDFYMLIRAPFLLCSICKCTCYYVAMMAILLLLFI